MEQRPEPESIWSVFSNRWAKLVVALVYLFLLGWVVYFLRRILVPFALAMVVAYILHPLVCWLEARLRWPRVAVVLVLMSVFTVLVLASLALGVYYTVQQVEQMVPAAKEAIRASQERGGLWGKVEAAVETIPAQIRLEAEKVIEDLPNTIRQNLRGIFTSVARGVGAVAGALLRVVLGIFSFVLFFVVAGYLLIDLPAIARALKDLLPRRHKGTILWVAHRINRDIHAFFRGQVLVALALAAMYSAGLVALGVDFALLIGVAAGLANIVPYLGIAVGLVPALLFSVVPYVGVWKPLGVWAAFVIAQNVEGFLLTPKIVGRQVGLNPVAVILAILVFGKIFGFLGVIFAVPLAAVIKVLLSELAAYYKRLQNRAGP
ncbi:MAG: AI-2E family transporter [Candidatus Brocadiia bacterium]